MRLDRGRKVRLELSILGRAAGLVGVRRTSNGTVGQRRPSAGVLAQLVESRDAGAGEGGEHTVDLPVGVLHDFELLVGEGGRNGLAGGVGGHDDYHSFIEGR